MSWPSRFACIIVIDLALAGCGMGSHDQKPAGETSRGTGKVVVTTAHGETLTFESFEVTCPKNAKDQWGQDADVVYAVAGLGSVPPRSRRKPMLILTAGAEVTDGTTVALPYDEVWGKAKTFVSVFITRAGKATELSAGPEESSGRIEIAKASCEPSPSIDISIDGTLHSEYSDGGEATVVGEVRIG